MENLRTLRSGTYATAKRMQGEIREANSRMTDVFAAIREKEKELIAEMKAAEEKAQREAEAAEEKVQETASTQENGIVDNNHADVKVSVEVSASEKITADAEKQPVHSAEAKEVNEDKTEKTIHEDAPSKEQPVITSEEQQNASDVEKNTEKQPSMKENNKQTTQRASKEQEKKASVNEKPSVKPERNERTEKIDRKPVIRGEKPETRAEIKEKTANAEEPAEKAVTESVAAEKPEIKATETVTEKTAAPNSGEITTKVYTDEKGNIKVRRFLTEIPRAPKESRQSKPFDKGQRPPYAQKDRNAGDRPSPQQKPTQENRENRFAKDKDDFKRPLQSTAQQRPIVKPDFMPPIMPTIGKQYGNKNKTSEKPEEKKVSGKSRQMLMKSYDMDDEREVVRRARPKKAEVKFEQVIKKIDHAVINTKEVVIKDLSEKIGVSVAEIIKKLFAEGIIKTINDKIEYEIAEYIASMFGVELTLKLKETAEDTLTAGVLLDDDNLPDTEKRPPIVTVMGHVDHGKTSLLDAIRKTNVTSGEAGGITQHIGAYQVTINGELITFIDTPGHEAFTAMRARGAQVTDIAIIVVAADDGVMPQTIEAINHAKAAGVPIVVAINKMDKNTANPDTVKTQLTEYGLVPEEWGGDNIMVPVSAKTGMGITELLESVLIVAEMRELKANPKKRATGTIIEAKLDKARGPVATVLIQNGSLKVGDFIIAGTADGKVRAMFDSKGKGVKEVGPSVPVEILGFSDVPNAGDSMFSVDEKLGKQVASERKDKEKLAKANASQTVSLEDLYSKINEGNMKTLNIIIKSDVQGSLEALKVSLAKISNEEVKVAPIHGGVGAITASDVMLAKASNAIIIGFNVRADNNAKASAEQEGVDIRLYRIIYDAVDDITSAMKGMLAPKYKDTIIGQVEVREVFKISGVGAVAGAYVTHGKVQRNSKIRVYRDNVMICDCELAALRRFKDDVKEVAQGYECGVSLVNYNDIKVGDVFEAYILEEIKR